MRVCLLSPQSLSRLHSPCGLPLCLPAVGYALFTHGSWGPFLGCFSFESTPAGTVQSEALMPLPSGHHSRCVRICFQGLPGRRLGTSSLRSCRVTQLGCCSSHVCGHFRTLTMDRSAELVESPLPVHGRPWRRSLRAPDSQRPRVASRKHRRCKAPVQKGLSRRCSLPTHLERVLEVRLSPSIVDSLSFVSHRLAHDACCLWPLIDCNFLLSIVGRRDSQTYTSCSSDVAEVLGMTLFLVGAH